MTRLRAPNGTPLAERIQMHTQVTTDGCWIWTGTVTNGGYGRMAVGRLGWMHLVHRLTYELYVGPIPDGLQIDHLCRVRSCCNPEHLEPVTHRENIRRGVVARRRAKARLAS